MPCTPTCSTGPIPRLLNSATNRCSWSSPSSECRTATATPLRLARVPRRHQRRHSGMARLATRLEPRRRGVPGPELGLLDGRRRALRRLPVAVLRPLALAVAAAGLSPVGGPLHRHLLRRHVLQLVPAD